MIKTNSYKIAPFRKFSRGYTGQTRVALRQNMKFTLDELALVTIWYFDSILGKRKSREADR
jgi:hypothetical protein